MTWLLVGIIALLLVILPFVIDALAERDFFFTKLPERTAVEVIANGKFHRFILAYYGHVLTRNEKGIRSVVTPLKDLPRLNRALMRLNKIVNPMQWLAAIGIYWLGIPAFYSVGWYNFAWAEPENKDGTTVRRERNEPTKYIYVNKFTYFPKIDNAYTKSNVPIDMDYLLVVQIQDLYTARHDQESWYDYTVGEINSIGRDYIGDDDFSDLTSESVRPTKTDGDPARKLMNHVKPLIPSIRKEAGVLILDIKVERVRLHDEKQHEDLQRALGAEFVAEQEAKADIARAKGRSTAADSEAERIQKVYSEIEKHPHGVEIRRMEALEKSGENGNSTNWVIGSGITDLVSAALRPKTDSALSDKTGA
jgi:regulator of protease activity HflC (stomatin/prohibitin superfamily)